MGSASSKVVPQSTRPAARASRFIDDKSLLSNIRNTGPKSADGVLQLANIDAWESITAADSKTQLARNVLVHHDIKTTLTSREAEIAIPHVFNTELELKTGPVTNQKSSGRCWLFATTNVIRFEAMKKLKLKDFQFSQVSVTFRVSCLSETLPPQSYLFFWDKLNKSNYYLELSIENAHLPVDDRLVNFLAGSPIGDGGQWDMVVNVLEVGTISVLVLLFFLTYLGP